MSEDREAALLRANALIEDAFKDVAIVACLKCEGKRRIEPFGMCCPACLGSGKTTGTRVHD